MRRNASLLSGLLPRPERRFRRTVLRRFIRTSRLRWWLCSRPAAPPTSWAASSAPNSPGTPVSTIGTSPYWVLVNPDKTKAANIRDFVAAIRARPGELSYAHGGTGGITHLASEMLRMQGKLDMVSVPFKGNVPAATEVLAGRIDMLIDRPASSEAFVKAGKLKALAVTSQSRIPTAPDVPTLNESGFRGFEAIAWFGIAFPRATPPEIVERMNREVARAVADPEVKAKLEAAGVTPGAMSTVQFTDFIKAEIVRWRNVIAEAKITTE